MFFSISYYPVSLFWVGFPSLAIWWAPEAKSASAKNRKVWPSKEYGSGPAWYIAQFASKITTTKTIQTRIRQTQPSEEEIIWVIIYNRYMCGFAVDLLQGVAPLCWTHSSWEKTDEFVEVGIVCCRFCFEQHIYIYIYIYIMCTVWIDVKLRWRLIILYYIILYNISYYNYIILFYSISFFILDCILSLTQGITGVPGEGRWSTKTPPRDPCKRTCWVVVLHLSAFKSQLVATIAHIYIYKSNLIACEGIHFPTDHFNDPFLV